MTQALELPGYYEQIGYKNSAVLAYHRVVLVSSHPLFLVGLRGEINSWKEFKVVGEANTASEVLDLVDESLVNLIVIDQARPGESLALIKALQARLNRRISLVVLGSSETETQITQLRHIGVTRFASKVLPVNQLREVLLEAAQQQKPLPGIRAGGPVSLLDYADERKSRPMPVARPLSPLSPREIQILEVIAQGRSNKEVAQVLCISNHTLKNHLNNIFKKLDVEDRTQALLLGVRNGWITL